MKLRNGILSLAVAAAAILPGLSGAQPASAGRPVEIRLADQIGSEVDYAALWVAEHEGYLADENIKLVRKTFANGPEGLLHFANGEIDIFMGGLAPIMQAAARGQELKILMSITKNNAPLVGRKEIASWKDLEGKTVGSPGLGTVQDAILSYVQASEKVRFKRVFAKVSDFVVMAGKGEIDAFISWEPAAALALAQDPGLHYVAQNPPIRNAESLLVISGPRFLGEHPEAVTGFVRAVLRGIDYIEKNPPEKVAQIVARKMNNPGAAGSMLKAMDSVIVTEPRIDMPSTRIILKTIADAGKVPAKLAEDPEAWINRYIDYSYLEKAESQSPGKGS